MQVTLNARFRSRPVTGVERFASEVSHHLARAENIDFHEIQPDRPISGLKGHGWEQLSLPRKLGKNSILFSPCNTGSLSVPRQLVVVHDAAVWDLPEGFSRSFRILYRKLLPALARKAAAIATVSEFSRDRLAEKLRLPAEKITVLGNAAGPEFSPDDSRSNPDNPPTLLCVGSIDPRKNTTRLIEAWIAAGKQGALPEGARLNIIGSARPSTFGPVEMTEAPGIHWLGRVSDEELITHYQSATGFIFPSLYEGFGLPPLEAMACGCPVLLSREASLPEVGGDAFDLRDPESKGAALYFDPRNTKEICAAMVTLLNLDAPTRNRLRFNALNRSSSFSWQNVAERTQNLLETLS
ncbi:MAG: glycosyltransferase family 1 protein [Verrucomicrobiota bacterium]